MNNKELKEKWVKALRSGEYKQGQGELRSGIHHFCCLGVLCDVYDKSNWEKPDELGYMYLHSTIFLPDELDDLVPISAQHLLAKMNDDDKASFNEIADWIEVHIPVVED